MKRRSMIDVFLLVLAMVLLVIVGYGIITRSNQAEVAKTTPDTDTAAADSVAQSADQALNADFGFSGGDTTDSASASLGDDPLSDSTSNDEVATLEEIAQPEVVSQSWDLVNGSFAIVRATMNVNVRVGPGLDYGVIRAIPKDSEVQVIRRSVDNNWIRVMLSDGIEGWIFGQLLELRQ